MRKITFSLFLSLGLLSFMANAQYTYDNLGPDPYSSSNFLFTGSGFTTTGFSNIHAYNAGGTGNTWSSVQTLPFAFDFFGTPVTHFIVSKNYLVSFDTSRAGLPVNAGLNDNTALPNAGLPDNTISIFWDNFANGSASLGTNDNVWTGVFGTAPNRQFYVKYYSYETGGRSFSYGHLVLEEGTNNIYMIDNYMGGTGGSMTIGVQKDTATAVQVAGSPNISPIVTTSSWTALEYYTFSPRLLSPNEAGISSVDAPSQPFAPGMQTVTATLTNHGTAALTSANIDWSANGVAQTGTTFSGSLAPNATTSINLGMYNFTGVTNLSVWSSLPNGVADPYTANDTTMVTLVTSMAGGVYTIDGTQAASATNFINFASAVTAMSGGISGAVTFNVAAGTYNEQVSIGSIIGSSDTNTITFNGASAASTILTHDKSIRNSTLNLNGTSDITIKNMTIAATGGSQSWAIHIWNDANDVIIDSNIITTPVGTTFDVVGIMVSGSETSDNTTADVDDITISNNTVTGGERGISIYGNFTASSRSQNLTIHNNDVQNADDNGFYIVGYNNVTITDNYVDGLTNAFSDGMYSSDLENFTITGNRFKGGDNGIEARDYNFDNTVTSKSLIANNMFIGGDDGLYFDDVEEVDVFHNSCVGADYGVYVNDDANVDFRNNIFMSDGGDIAYYSLDASTTVTLDYNLYYTTGATLAKFGTPTYADLAAFQAGQTALNVNSVSGDPVFLDRTADLHAAGTTANDAGDNTVGITVDYDGDTRPLAPSTTVDIGADEFAPPACASPGSLASNGVTATTASLTWVENGTATRWEVEYGALGFALGTGTRDTTSSNPFSISGLTSSTDYEYYVRSICGVGDSSAFAGPGSFTTAFQCPAGATCATYTAGDIPTDNAVSYPAPSSCPGSLSLVIPAGDQIDSISTFYDMTAAGGAWMSEQGSYLYSPTTMNFEASGNNGSGTSAGTFSYSRDGLTFANGVTGTVAIEMHAERSWGGSGCGTAQNKVDNGTWTVIAYHSPAPLAPISLPITWDNGATVDLTTIDFGGNTSTLVADPTNASNTVLQSIKGAGAQTWGGTTFGDSLATPIAFASGMTTIRAVVYSPTSGIEVRLKVEDKTNPAISVETGVQTMVVNGWDTLSFNFTNNAAGTGAINFANTYDKMSIFYNFGVSPTAAETFYVDYVEDVSANAAPPVPAKAAIALPITWDDTANVDYSVIDFGGNNSMSVADPTNATNIVLQSIKGAGAQTWGGTTFGDSLASAIPFSAGNTTIRAVVYSPTAGTPVRLKVEDYNNPAISVETEVLTTVANGWDTLNFDMSVQAPTTAAINFANTYNKMSIFYNFGTSPTAAETYYVDYVEFGNPPNVIGIPYTQNFDAFPAGNISSEGWTNSRGSSVPDWTTGGSTGSSGTGPLQDHTTGTGLFVYTETSGTTAGVVDTLSSPAVTFTATNTSIELNYYYHMHGSTMGDLQVWVDTNGVWDSLTTYVGQQQANQADPWMKGSHILNGYEGQQVTVHFLGVSGASFRSDMAVDDVTLDIPPSCIEPSSLVTTSIGADSAVLGWTENNAATTWEVEWGPVGFTPGTGTVVSANANPFTLSGLSTLTEYSWRVRSLCSPTDSSLWSVMSSFKTAFQCPAGAICNTYTAGDISTDDAVSYPAQSACPGSMDLIIPTGNRIDSVRSFYDMTAQNGAWMSEQESYLYSPTTMNIEPGASAGAGNGAGTMNYDRSGLTFANGGVDTVVVELHAIRTWSSAGNAGCSTFNNKVDSASWTVVAYYSAIPLCLEPTGLTGTGTGTTTASVSWTSANTPVAPSYEVSYGPVGFTAGAGTQVTSSTTSTTLTSLTASTTYDFYVRANCGATSTSPWSLVGSFATFNGVPYFQDFEAFTNGSPSSEGWSNFKTSNPQWLVDQGTTPSAGSGTGPTVDHTTGTATGRFVYLETSVPGVAGDADTLYSAVISVGANQNVLELSYWYHMFGATIGSLEAWVEDSSGALTQVGTIVGQQQTVTADPYLRAKHVVNGFANQTIRLVFVGVRGTSFTGDIAIDDVRLDLPPAAEVGITDILRPSSGCGLGADSVEVEITNFGSAAQTGFNIGYSINGVAITPETVSATLGAGMTMNYTFSTTAALGTSGTYDIETYTLLTGDADTSNDTLGVTVNSFASVSAFPYATSFETSNDSWFATGDASWELGAPIGFVIDTAANGTQAWVTDLDAAYGDGLNAFLTSPCFDFSTVANPAINLDIWYDIESQWDGAFLQATTDGGATWNTIGNEGDIINWYNDTSRVAVDNNYSAFGDSWTGDGSISGVNGTNGWIEASHELNGLGGQANVQLRIVFSSDANTNGDGMGVDNIEIYDRDPSYPIALLNTEDASGVADSLNVDAWTSGIVVGIDLDGNNGISFTIIDDESGFQEGMNIFNFNDVSNYVVTEGDEILVHGDIIQFRGLTELSPDSILVLSTGNNIPTPIVVSNLDETTESKWLSIPTSWVSLSTSGSFSSNIDLTNGVDTITMRIDSDTDINDSLTASGMPIVPGDTICGLFGIGGQYASSTSAPFLDGYQIFPMRWSDLTICRLSTGIENVDVETSRFSLVPNPTNGLFEIRSSGFNNSTVNISIRDISGRLISSEIVNNANGNFTKSFDLNEESAGIYFITIVDGESIINEKLILK